MDRLCTDSCGVIIPADNRLHLHILLSSSLTTTMFSLHGAHIQSVFSAFDMTKGVDASSTRNEWSHALQAAARLQSDHDSCPHKLP